MRDGAPGADRVGRGERWGIPLADSQADVRPVEDLTMRPAISVSLILIATVLQACGPDTPTGVRPLANFMGPGHKHHARPIKGRCTIGFQVEPLEFGPAGQITKAQTPFTGTCLISGLGRSSVTGGPTVTFNSDGSGAASGPVVFRAANGAELRTAAAATFPPLDEGDVPLAGTLEFNGGTGRFAEADGSATLNLTIDLDERTGELEFRGAMSP